MKVTYYPGCSLEGMARDYNDSIQGVCHALGVELQEVSDWNCCGATAAHSINHKAGIELAARNLKLASRMPNSDMLVPCPLCYNRLKSAACALQEDKGHHFDIRLDSSATPKITELAQFFGSDEMLKRLAEQVKKSLENLKVVCYYGCMASRPPRVTQAPDHENPQSMDRIVTAVGATSILWPFKTDCCGAGLSLSRPDMLYKLVGKLYDMALRVGAQAIVVSCQMCQANLDMYQDKIEENLGRKFGLPIFYFTELIGLACGLPGTGNWVSRHFTDPRPLLAELGIIEGLKC